MNVRSVAFPCVSWLYKARSTTEVAPPWTVSSLLLLWLYLDVLGPYILLEERWLRHTHHSITTEPLFIRLNPYLNSEPVNTHLLLAFTSSTPNQSESSSLFMWDAYHVLTPLLNWAILRTFLDFFWEERCFIWSQKTSDDVLHQTCRDPTPPETITFQTLLCFSLLTPLLILSICAFYS